MMFTGVWYINYYIFQTLDPSESIPEEMYEMGFSEEVLKHECPDYLKDVKDEEVYIYVQSNILWFYLIEWLVFNTNLRSIFAISIVEWTNLIY